MLKEWARNKESDAMNDEAPNLTTWMKFGMAFCITLLVASSLIGGCSYINDKLDQDDDWVGEEIVEYVIENQTGISIDLTPDSPEK